MLRNWSARIKKLQERFGLRKVNSGLERIRIVHMAEGQSEDDVELPPGTRGAIIFPYDDPEERDRLILEDRIEGQEGGRTMREEVIERRTQLGLELPKAEK